MKRPEIKNLFRKAIKEWGLSLQLGMLMEECAELIQATHKVVRNMDKQTSVWRGMIEEIADVEIMIDQIKTTVTWENIGPRVETAKHDKLRRLKKMLEEE